MRVGSKAVTRAAVSSKVAARRERRYEKLRTIGSGTFGTAHLVRRRGDPPAPRGLSERRLVLKKIRLARMTDAQRAQSYEEMALLMRFQCPGVLRHVESWVERGCYVCVVTAFYERGDLLAQLQAARNDDAVAGFDESLLAEWLVAVGTGLEQMHAAGCLHRDVKSSNIFLGADGLPALGDFGLACQLPEGETLAQPGECVGTPNYMSPELVQDRPYGDKSDVWALGCVFFELTALKPAFMAFDMRGLKAKIVAAKLPALPQEYSSEWRSLVRSMLAADPQRRPSMREVLQSAVLAEAAERFRVKVAEAQEREKKEETLWERLRAEAAEARAQAAEKAAEAKAEAGKAGEGSPGATQKEKLPKVWGGGGFGLQDKGFRGAARTRAAGSAVIAAAKITPFEVRRAAAREARQESRRTRQSPSPSLQPNGGDDGRGGRLGRQSPSPRVGVGGAGGSARITRAASASSHNPRTTPSSTSAERPPRLARRTPGVAHRSSATSASTPASAARARSARASHSSHKKAGVAGASALLSKRSPKDRRPPSGKPPRSVPKAMPRASAAAPKPAPAVPRPAAKRDKVPTKTPSASKPAKTRTALPEVKSPSPQPRGAQRRTPVASSQARTAAARRVAVAAAAREAEAAAARRAENIARSAAGATASKPWRAAMKEAPTIEQMLKAGGGRLGAGGGNAYLAYARYAKVPSHRLRGLVSIARLCAFVCSF